MNNNYSHSLVDLLRGYCEVPAALDTRLSGIAIDSRKVKKGDLFIAIASGEAQSKAHIAEALSKGANAILREGTKNCRVHEDKDAVEVCLSSLHESVGAIASRFYLNPSSDLKVIGVTGTNGKTSVANYTASYLSKGGKKCGVMGTLGYGLVDEEDGLLTSTGYTTPDVVEVHRNLAVMRDDGAEVVVMEVSSHALCQHRVDSVVFFGAIFTNLSRDHLDYHGSMSDYAKAKQKLFKAEGLRFAVLNKDDEYFNEFKDVIDPVVELKSYGQHNHTADVSVLTKEYEPSGIKALVKVPVGQVTVDSSLLGEFNLSNLLAVIATAHVLDDMLELEARISEIKAVPGRMEVIHLPGHPTVVVDYAHTPDALENVLRSLRTLCDAQCDNKQKGQLRLIFGCGGDRDQGKRSEMARVAELLADDIIVTDDNPRGELPEAIIADIVFGFEDESNVDIVHDRKLAISQMLDKSKENDVVLLAGKGHEEWQEVQGQRHYFSDTNTVRALLAKGCATECKEQEVMHD